MWGSNQKTLRQSINFTGVGLHSGEKIFMKIEPAEFDTGITFKRTDLKENNEIAANFKNVSSAKLCTKIENKIWSIRFTVGTFNGSFLYMRVLII